MTWIATITNLQPLLDGEADLAEWDKRYMHADGHTVWAHVSVSALRHADGTPRLLIAQIEDISERLRIEQQLRTSEQRLALAQRAAGIGTWDWDVTTDVIFWAPEMEEIYGLPPGGFEGRYEGWSRSPSRRSSGPEHDLTSAVRRLTDFGTISGSAPADGAERWIAASARPYLDEAGGCHVVGVNIDVTDRSSPSASWPKRPGSSSSRPTWPAPSDRTGCCRWSTTNGRRSSAGRPGVARAHARGTRTSRRPR